MIKIDIQKAPVIAKLISTYLNNLSYSCSVYNIGTDDSDTEIKITKILSKDPFFMDLIHTIDKYYEAKAEIAGTTVYDFKFYENLLKNDKIYNNLSELLVEIGEEVSNFKKSKVTIKEIYTNFIVNWNHLLNIRLLVFRINEGHEIYQKALNYSIYNLYVCYASSKSLKDFFLPLFDQYYYGYIVGNDTLRNLFLGYCRMYLYLKENTLENENLDRISVKSLLESIFDVEVLFAPKNKKFIIEAFKILINYTQRKFQDSYSVDNETDLYLAHARLNGFMKLITYLKNDYEFLNESISLKYYINFFKEIYCDRSPFKFNSIHILSTPKYQHWLLWLFVIRQEDCKVDNILPLRKERIFLSNQVADFLRENDLNSENSRRLLKEVDLIYSYLDYRVVLPISNFLDMFLPFLRTEIFTDENFDLKIKTLNNSIENYYETYKNLEIWNVKDLSSDEVDSIKRIHYTLAQEEIEKVLYAIQRSEIDIEERIYELSKYEFLYPYNTYIKHEMAIILDENNKTQEALDLIIESIILNFNDIYLWKSFVIVLSKLAYDDDAAIASYIHKINS